MPGARNAHTSGILAVFGLFLLSGATGLAYEVIWTRMLVRVFGASSFAVSTVLATYMAGLAVGSYLFGRLIDRKGNPILIYGLLELGIGAFALIFPFILAGLNPLYRALYGSLEGSLYTLSLIRFLLSFAVLIIPTTLMGGTLPVLSRLVTQSLSDLTFRVGWLYAINTFGAVAGTLVTGFLLLPHLGMRATTLAVVATNVAIFVTAYLLSRKDVAQAAVAPSPDRHAQEGRREEGLEGSGVRSGRSRERIVLVAFLFTGLAALSGEVIWTRVLALVVGTTVYAFSIMLTVFLLGLAVGSAVFARIAQNIRRPRLTLGLVAAAIGLAVFAGTVAFRYLPAIYMDLYKSVGKTWQTSIGIEFLLSFAIMIVPAFLMGGTFPLVARIYATDVSHVGSRIGTAYAYNTVGSIVGSFVGSFVLLEALGVEKGMLTVSLVYLAVGALLLLLLSEGLARRLRLAWSAAVAAAAIAVALLGPGWDTKLMTSAVYVYAGVYRDRAGLEDALKFKDVLFYDEGAGATVSIERNQNVISLKIDGKVDASSGSDMINQEFLAHIPLLMHPKPDTVLVIGLGSSVTLGSAARHPVKHIDCVELLENVVTAAGFFEDIAYGCLSDPRVNLILGDGRNHVQLTRKKYDVIISEPTNVWISGVGDLFDYEFFRLARERLKPGGVMAAWFHTYHMGDAELRSGVRTFLEVFPHASLWLSNESDIILVGALGGEPEGVPGNAEYDESSLARMAEPEVARDLARVLVKRPADLLSALLLDEADLREYSRSARIHTDDNMLMEFNAGRRVFEATHQVHLANILERFRPRRFGRLDEATNSETRHQVEAKRLAMRGTLERFRNNLPEALRCYDGAYAAAPLDPYVASKYVEVHYQMGDALLDRGDFEGARTHYRAVAEAPLTPDTWVAYDGLGAACLAKGDYAGARVAFEAALGLNPYNSVGQMRLGDIYLAEADTVQAIAAYDKALETGPWNHEAANSAAWLRAVRGQDLDRALAMAKAITRDTQEANYFDTLGWVYYRKGDFGRAAGALERACALAPDAPEPMFHLALVEKARGRTARMKELLVKVVRIDPTGTFGDEARALLEQ